MNNTKVNAIVTGVTGMVGEGVLNECLLHPNVENVLVINRRPCGIVHPKLKEIIHQDFYNFEPIKDQLGGYNAAFLCLGVTSVGKKEPEYYKLTYTLTLHFAELLSKINNNMTICYVSGVGTDSSENGKSMWARVKGKTENDLMKLPFKKVFPFRPGFIKPTEGMKNTHKFYKYINWLFPLGRALYPKGFCTLQEVGLAMINSVNLAEDRKIIEGKDIIELSKKIN
jgi:hypothetical protein